jgi:hypothetical protein
MITVINIILIIIAMCTRQPTKLLYLLLMITCKIIIVILTTITPYTLPVLKVQNLKMPRIGLSSNLPVILLKLWIQFRLSTIHIRMSTTTTRRLLVMRKIPTIHLHPT